MHPPFKQGSKVMLTAVDAQKMTGGPFACVRIWFGEPGSVDQYIVGPVETEMCK